MEEVWLLRQRVKELEARNQELQALLDKPPLPELTQGQVESFFEDDDIISDLTQALNTPVSEETQQSTEFQNILSDVQPGIASSHPDQDWQKILDEAFPTPQVIDTTRKKPRKTNPKKKLTWETYTYKS